MQELTKKHVIRVGACTDVGSVRKENQDSLGLFPDADSQAEERLFIVADGMGGHEHGREASGLAVAVVQEVFFGEAGSIEERLQKAYVEANRRIRARAAEHSGIFREKMGTTCTTLVLVSGQFYLAHIGDSRAYRVTTESIEQLTADHTWVERMRLEGVLTDEEAANHPRRNALLRALGIEDNVEADVQGPFDPVVGECILICSDGLAPVPLEEVQTVVSEQADPQAACERLVEMAIEHGAPDNVTVLIIAF